MRFGELIDKKIVEKFQKVAKHSDYLRRRAERSQAKKMDVRFCAFR